MPFQDRDRMRFEYNPEGQPRAPERIDEMALNTASEKKLVGVKPDLVKVVRRAAELTKQPFQIVQGNRTQAEQNKLYDQGRGSPGPIVTWTKKSKHIGGGAVDFAALVNGTINWQEKYYPAVAHAFKVAAVELGIGIEWGGDWKTKDWGHIQLTGRVTADTTTPAPPPYLSSERPLLKKGSDHEDVFVLQRLLNQHGATPVLIVDGDFGNKTEHAVEAFQRAKGLVVDAVVWKKTWPALEAEPAPATLEAVEVNEIVADALLNSIEQSEGQTNPEIAMAFFKLRWAPHQAAAIVGHAQQESYKDLRPDAVGDNGESFGIFQWNGPRQDGLKAFATQSGLYYGDLTTQLAYVEYELKTTEKRAAELLKKATTVEEAVKAFMGYERPSGFSWAHPERGHGYANRLRNAKALLLQ